MTWAHRSRSAVAAWLVVALATTMAGSGLADPVQADTRRTQRAAAVPSYELISVSSSGEAGNDSSYLGTIAPIAEHPVSSDGRFVAFESSATNFRSGDDNETFDLFLRDRTAGWTYHIATGPFPGDGPSQAGGSEPALSPDGSLLAYKEVVPDYLSDGSACYGTWVTSTDFEDALPPEPVPLLHPTDPTGIFGCVIGQSLSLSNSGDLVFVAARNSLVDGESNDEGDIMLWRYGSQSYQRLIDFPYNDGGCNANSTPAVSADGRHVAFRGPQGVVDRCAQSADYVHLQEVTGGNGQIVSRRDGSPVRATSFDLAAGGQHVVFTSQDATGRSQVYVRDVDAGTTKLASVRPNGEPFDHAFGGTISDDGRFVAFVSDEGLRYRDVDKGTTTRVTSGFDGQRAAVTGNGSAVGFTYGPSSLTAEDTNDAYDVYLWDTGSTGSLSGKVAEGVAASPQRGGDGHSRVLAGAKVELRQNDQVVYGPTATDASGRYRFANVAAGTYRLRITLEDSRHQGDSGLEIRHFEPIFDVRHSENATGPAWVEVEVDIDGAEQRDVAFSDKEDLAAATPDVTAGTASHLDDMAAIFNRLQDYVGWLIEEIFPDMNSDTLQLPVEIHAFSALRHLATDGRNGFYSPQGTNIHMGAALSDFSERDGYGNDWGPFAEWHELTHHLEFVNEISTSVASPCNGANHKGFSNPSTCDSLLEGLAEFLPTLAYADLEPVDQRWQKGHYPVSGLHLESNDLDSWLMFLARKRDGTRVPVYREEYAVAGLLWDLVDERADHEREDVLNAAGDKVAYEITDNVDLNLESLWALLVQEKIRTVRILWNRLHVLEVGGGEGLKDLSIDIDNDGVMDTSPLDVPFILHGFHPLANSAGAANATDYDLRSAAALGITGTSPNRGVGRTDSHHPEDPAAYRTPRNFPEPVEGATLDIGVFEKSGAAVTSGDVVFQVAYPEGFTDTFRYPIPPDGDIGAIQLELPLGVDVTGQDELAAELATGCTNGSEIAVTIHPRIDGIAGDETSSFSSCDLAAAVAEADEGEPALSFEFEVPKRPSDVSVTVRRTRGRLVLRGKLVPASPGSKIALVLQKKRPSGWKKLAGTKATLSDARDPDGDGVTFSRYRKRMARRGRGKCRIVARFPGDAGHFKTKATTRFRC